MDEIQNIKDRYKRRAQMLPNNKYCLTNSHILMAAQEKERLLIKQLKKKQLLPLDNKRILEVGCGTGSNLLDFIKFGASPQNITGNDLLEHRISYAKEHLPGLVELICCDFSEISLEENKYDIILQYTVFTSILDNHLQEKIADKMWKFLKPGGVIIWYDFIHANPYNADVRAVPIKRIKQLFPYGEFTIKRLTLVPFLSELITKQFYFPYSILNCFPFLRMHVLCFIAKTD